MKKLTVHKVVMVSIVLLMLVPPISYSSHTQKTEFHWIVSDARWLGLEGAKFSTAKEACTAGIAAKERINRQNADRGMRWRINPDRPFYFGGSYTWGNLDKAPGDPGFSGSGEIYCNHEYWYSYPGWATFWPYSGANVHLRGDSCPAGKAWNKEVIGCVPIVDYTPPCDKNKDCNNGNSGSNSNTIANNSSNPVNGATGNKSQTEVDYQSSQGRLTFVRYYNSKQNEDINDASNRGMGAKWTSTYDFSIDTSSNGTAGGQAVSLIRAGTSVLQSAVTYARNPRDGYYTYMPPSMGSISASPAATGWNITRNDGTKEVYDAEGVLQSITKLDGYTKTLSYYTNSGFLQSVTDSDGRSLTFLYDASNRLETLITPDGNITYAYSASNNLSRVSYPDGTSKNYVYEDARYPYALTGIVDENGNRYASWAYDDQGRANKSEHANGAERVDFVYNTDGTTTLTDSLGASRIYHFTTAEGFRKVSKVGGPVCKACGTTEQTATYDSKGNRNVVTDFNGVVTDYDYDRDRNLMIKRTVAVGTAQERTTRIEWHPNFPRRSCVIESTRTSIMDYHTDSMLQTRTEVDTSDPLLFPDAASKTCDAIKARADFATLNQRAWHYTYDDNNRLASVDGPRTDVTDIINYVYDGNNGNLTRVTNAAGHIVDITAHDASGRPLRIVDANGLVTQLSYTPRGWTDLIKIGSDTVFETTDLDYDGAGQLVRTTLPDGSFLTYDYDAAHRLTDIRDQQGNHIHYTLDTMGNRTAVDVSDPGAVLKRTHAYVFSTLNQLTQSIGTEKGLDTQVMTFGLYDANGNLQQTTDAQGNLTDYGYDALARLSQVTDVLNGTTHYSYDTAGNLETVTDPRGNITRYQYDGLGNLIQLDSPDTGITQYTNYDGAGNLITKTGAKGQTTAYQYDVLNRLTQTTYADATSTLYIYDVGINSLGRLSSITDPTGNTTYAYDLQGRITNKTQTVSQAITETPATIILPMSYRYNAQGQLDQSITPTGKVIGYHYNNNGQVDQITVDGTVVLNNISYDPFGPATGWDMGSSTNRISRNYDLDGQLQRYTSGDTLKQLHYANTGNIVSLIDTGNATNDQYFDYDGLYRLTNFDGLNQTHIYDYDANGNRTAQTIDGTLHSYSVDAISNRLQSVAGPVAKTYTYDANGNTIDDGINTYQYDARNRLVSINDGDLSTYLINGLGQRVFKNAPANPADANGDGVVDEQDLTITTGHNNTNVDCNGDGKINGQDTACIAQQIGDFKNQGNGTTKGQGQGLVNITAGQATANQTLYFSYDEAGQLVGEYDKDGNAVQETIYLGNLPVAVLKNNNVYYIHADHLNTPRAITDSNNAVVWTWHSDPFGTTQAEGKGFTYNLRFPGQYFDSETGTHYNYFRYYDPSTGRYITSDPIGMMGGLNTYTYVLNNPLRLIDMYGLDARDIQIILSDLRNRFPHFHIPNSVIYDETKELGSYDRDRDEIHLPPDRKCEVLDTDTFLDRYQTVYHETLHANQGIIEGLWEDTYEYWTGNDAQSHLDIGDKARELVRGKPGQPNSSIADEIEDLFFNTR